MSSVECRGLKLDLNKFPRVWMTWTIAMMNFLAFAGWPYGYYEILRLVVTGYAGYMAYIYFQVARPKRAWAFTSIALLYNPIFPIEMSKDAHTPFNFVTGAFVLYELYKLRSDWDTKLAPPQMTDDALVEWKAKRAEQDKHARDASTKLLRRSGFVIAGLIFLVIASVGGYWGYLEYEKVHKTTMLGQIEGTPDLNGPCNVLAGTGVPVKLVNHTSQTVMTTSLG